MGSNMSTPERVLKDMAGVGGCTEEESGRSKGAREEGREEGKEKEEVEQGGIEEGRKRGGGIGKAGRVDVPFSAVVVTQSFSQELGSGGKPPKFPLANLN